MPRRVLEGHRFSAEPRGDPRPARRRFCGVSQARKAAKRGQGEPPKASLSAQRRAEQPGCACPATAKHPWAAATGAGPGPITCRERGSGPGTRRRGRAVPAPALSSLRSLPSPPFLSLLFPSLLFPLLVHPFRSRALSRSVAAAASAEPGASGWTGKFVSNFVAFSLVSALLACCLGSQMLISVALFRLFLVHPFYL